MDVVVQHAELVPGPRGEGMWKIAVELHRDGEEPEKVASFVPADAVEWRIAQYNVDARTAIEMILVEPHAGHDHEAIQLAPTRSEARTRKLATITAALGEGKVSWAAGPSPWRVGIAEGEQLLADSGDGDPLATIIEASPVDDELIAVKREAMDTARARFRQRAAPLLAEPVPRANSLRRPTPEELRARLMPEPPTTGE